MATKTMAKPKETIKASKGFNFAKFDERLSKIEGFESGSILATNVFSEVNEWIDCGNHMLNAQFSGTLFGGIPNTRSVGFAGDPGSGKTFLCLNIVREAQKKGYFVFYCDTEGAVDREQAANFGIDVERIRYQPIKLVSQFKTFVVNIINMLKEEKKKDPENPPKFMIVLDSIGMLTTDKEQKDAAAGHNAQDMGLKAKELRSLFRNITLDLAEHKIPLIATNHTACLTAGHKIIKSDGTLEFIENIKSGDTVKTLDGDKVVINNFEYENQAIIELELENGQVLKCTPTHKLLVSNDWTNEISWKEAQSLNEGDYILKLDE